MASWGERLTRISAEITDVKRAVVVVVELPTLILGLVVVARFVRDSFIMRELIHTAVKSSSTSAAVAAVDDMLGGEVGGRPGSTPLYVDAIRQRTRRSKRPA